MKVNFDKIIIDNFLSFGHAELSLRNKGYTLIEGINHNPSDCAESNGSGKSTIFSALCFALTGETIKGLSTNLRNKFIPNANMSVELHFSVDGDMFEITRSRDSKDHGDLKVIVNGVDKSGKGLRESEAVLNQYLPTLKSDLIGEVIIIGQGMPHKFSDNTPSGRKDLLEKLSNSDLMLADIRARVDSRFENLKNQKFNIDSKLIELKTKDKLTDELIYSKKEELKKYDVRPDFENIIKDLEKKVTCTTTEKDSLVKSNKDLDKTLTENQTKLSELIQEENDSKEEETKVFNAANLSIKTKITELTFRIDSLVKEIKEKQDIKDICPLCGQKIPHVHKPDLTPLIKQKEELENQLGQLNEKDNTQKTAYKLNIKDIEEEYRTKKDLLSKYIRETKESIEKMDKQISILNDQLKNEEIQLSNTKKEKDFFEENLKKCEDELTSLEKDKDITSNQISYNIHDQENIQEHIDIVNKMITYVKRDFRGILLTNVISYIDNKAKEYSQDIFGTRDLDFKLEGNNINITYLGKPLEALSGGEAQKVDLITQFAIRSMMQEYTGFSSNILVLDEILDNLDALGCDKVLNFISNKLSDIESIFIISHHAGSLNIGNDSTITVIKDNTGVSSLYEK